MTGFQLNAKRPLYLQATTAGLGHMINPLLIYFSDNDPHMNQVEKAHRKASLMMDSGVLNNSNNSFNSSESNSCEPSSCKHSRRRHSEDAGRTLKAVPVSFNGLLVSTETEAERLDRLLEEQVDCPTNNNNGICMEVAIPDGR